LQKRPSIQSSFGARSRYLRRDEQQVVLSAIVAKLVGASVVFTHGEDERFARAVLSVVYRTDLDPDGFAKWLARARPAPATAARPSPDRLRSSQNVKNMLAKLEVLLSLDSSPSGSVQAARANVQTALKDLF
jgi:hypothetical protein